MAPDDNREPLRRKLTSPNSRNEKIQTRGYTPVEVTDFLNLKGLLTMLDGNSLSSLSENTSMAEALEILALAISVIKNLFVSNKDLYEYNPVNPELIVGETGPDGVVESRKLSKKVPRRETNAFVPFLQLINTIVVAMKRNISIEDKLLWTNLEHEVIEFFHAESRLAERIREDIEINATKRSIQNSNKERPMPNLGQTLPSREENNSSTAADLAYARNLIHKYVRKYGLMVIPKTAKNQLSNKKVEPKRAQKSRRDTTSKRKVVKRNQNRSRKSKENDSRRR